VGPSAERVSAVDPHILICVVDPWVHGRLRREVRPAQRGSFLWTHGPHGLRGDGIILVARYYIDEG
jgi:hypothetical protein